MDIGCSRVPTGEQSLDPQVDSLTRAGNQDEGTPVTTELTAAEICSLLDLEPNATCGSTRVSIVSQQSIAAGALPAPFVDGRPLGSARYFLVTPDSPVRLHRIRNEQLYHDYLGDPLEVFMLHADGSSERVVVGPNIRGGERLQLRIPGNTFHTARVVGRRITGQRGRSRSGRSCWGSSPAAPRRW